MSFFFSPRIPEHRYSPYGGEAEGFHLQFRGEVSDVQQRASLYDELGLERFWHLPDWDPLNVHRKPLQEPAE